MVSCDKCPLEKECIEFRKVLEESEVKVNCPLLAAFRLGLVFEVGDQLLFNEWMKHLPEDNLYIE